MKMKHLLDQVFTVKMLAEIASEILEGYPVKNGSDDLEPLRLALSNVFFRADRLIQYKVCPELGVHAEDLTLSLSTVEAFLGRPDVIACMNEVLDKAEAEWNFDYTVEEAEFFALANEVFELKTVKRR